MLLMHPPVAVGDLRRLRFLTVLCQENPSLTMSRCCSSGTHGSAHAATSSSEAFRRLTDAADTPAVSCDTMADGSGMIDDDLPLDH
jgi:hypothetical protein